MSFAERTTDTPKQTKGRSITRERSERLQRNNGTTLFGHALRDNTTVVNKLARSVAVTKEARAHTAIVRSYSTYYGRRRRSRHLLADGTARPMRTTYTRQRASWKRKNITYPRARARTDDGPSAAAAIISRPSASSAVPMRAAFFPSSYFCFRSPCRTAAKLRRVSCSAADLPAVRYTKLKIDPT